MTNVSKKMKLFAGSALMVGSLTYSLTAVAATDTATMAVSTSVAVTCTISTTALAFGTYDPVSANASVPLDQTSTVTITCTDGASVTVGLDLGLNEGAGTQRKMVNGAADALNYDLFSESTRTTAWDETTTVTRTGTGVADVLTVYGRVPAAQTNAQTGTTYNDTVVATVTF